MSAETSHLFRDTIQHHSKSFSVASRLIPADSRHAVEVLYTWCRQVDDAIDLAPRDNHKMVLRRLEAQLGAIYQNAPSEDPIVCAMQDVVTRYEIPRLYPTELLLGMEMDSTGYSYQELDALLLYCYRVAGTVGLMMSHVLGVREEAALQHAVHLGIAMQITNICRDVVEDWDRDRLYIPQEILAQHGAEQLTQDVGHKSLAACADALAASVADLLDIADQYYASADKGMLSLNGRSALAVRSARYIYADIGRVLRARHCAVFSGRAYVSRARKYALIFKALSHTLIEFPSRAMRPFARAPLPQPLRFPQDVLLFENEGRCPGIRAENRTRRDRSQ